MASPAKYVAEIHPVREVMIRGTANLEYWQQKLQGQSIRPVNHDGSARLMLTAIESSWMGIGFRELSMGLLVESDVEHLPASGIYLPLAFNSSRFFAFCERTFFRTPYRHADVQVEANMPLGLTVRSGGKAVIRAAMSDSQRESTSEANETWEGPIFLEQKPGANPQWFWARLAGNIQTIPFLPSDTLEFASQEADALAWFAESEFTPREWLLRAAGTHARSKTVSK